MRRCSHCRTRVTADVFFKPTTAGAQTPRLVASTMDGTLQKSVGLSGTGL